MALQLRKSIIQRALLNAALVFGIGMAISYFSGSRSMSMLNLSVLLLLAAILGGVMAWLKLHDTKQRIVKRMPANSTYARIGRDHVFDGDVTIAWQHLDDYAAQLQAKGFRHLGDFTSWPGSNALTGVAVMYCDPSGSIMVEIQYIQLSAKSIAHSGTSANGVHFSILSIVGGRIRVVTSDHTPKAPNYLMRSITDVSASYPGENLMSLLDKHRRLVKAVCERTNKQVTPGLTMDRYIMLMRERFTWVRDRLATLAAWEMMGELDRFEANPLTNWAPPTATLSALPERSLDDLDLETQWQQTPLTVDLAGELARQSPQQKGERMEAMSAKQLDDSGKVQVVTSSESDGELTKLDDKQLQTTLAELITRQVASSASWFYWIAGLSVLNLVAALLGSTWNFALGLGFSQLLYGAARHMHTLGTPGGALLVMYAGCIGSILFMGACGYFARKPSAFVFAVGAVSYLLDSLIFLLGVDVLGILLHLLALYYLFRGWRAARVLRGLQSLQATS